MMMIKIEENARKTILSFYIELTMAINSFRGKLNLNFQKKQKRKKHG